MDLVHSKKNITKKRVLDYFYFDCGNVIVLNWNNEIGSLNVIHCLVNKT